MRYFGTDGIRGKVGDDTINETFARRLGFALAEFLRNHHKDKPLTVAIGRDTRASGLMLQEALCQGLCEEGLHVVRLGVVPSPAISMSVRDLHVDLGISITASHNPASDNGIKLFDNRGLKFSKEVEAEIEALIDSQAVEIDACDEDCGYDHDARAFYASYMSTLLHQDSLKGWKIVLDTANGAACETSVPVFEQFGADLICIGNHPDGQNINDGIGSEHTEQLVAKVKARSAKLGIAHDGDADRVVFCDETGSVLTGEEVMGAVAIAMKEQSQLSKDTMVTTIQSNLGLDHALAEADIQTIRVDVGDRNVLMALREHGLNFGGESSGHYLFLDHSLAGDGLLTAIQVASLMLRSGKPLSELRKVVTLFPQKNRNLRVAEKIPLELCKHLQAAMADAERQLGDSGRILIRYSGTEPKLRLLVEGQDGALAEQLLESICAAAGQDLKVV